MKKILRFTASWCGPCETLTFRLANIKFSIPMETIDIDQHPDKATQYNVKTVPTLIIIDEDKEVDRIIGLHTASVIQKWVRVHVEERK